jgi:hypothetical protein
MMHASRTKAVKVDASLSYLNIILLNDFSHSKNLSTAGLMPLPGRNESVTNKNSEEKSKR